MYYGSFLYDPTYFLVIIGILLSLAAQFYVTSTLNKYNSILARKNFTASQVAKMIMDANGITDVQIGHVSGNFTDHYAPTKKELNLSDSIYDSYSIASYGVAAHEVGHAIQDNTHFSLLSFQISLVPTLSLVSKAALPVFFVGLLLSSFELMQIGIIAFSATLIYQLITLPIEFDASRRAIVALDSMNILDEDELYGAKKVLTAAALTYVAAAASTALQLLRFIMIANSRRRD